MKQALIPTGIITINNTPFPIWVTIRNSAGSKTDYGYVAARVSRIWLAGKYSQGESVTVQGEIELDAKNYSGKIACLTRIKQVLGDFTLFTFQVGNTGHRNFTQEPLDTNITITSSSATYNVWVHCMELGEAI